MRKKINLFLDDDFGRSPHKLTWIELPLVEWTIVRNYDDFCKAVLNNDINMLSYDHDLSNEHYQEYHRAHNSDKTLNYNNVKERTGYHCALFLAEYYIANKLPIPPYFVHSMNYMGKENIISVMESAKKVLKQNT